MEFVRADTDFGSQPELPTVVESRAGIDHDSRTVHGGHETARGCQVARHNGVGVVRAVVVDVCDGLVQRADDS